MKADIDIDVPDRNQLLKVIHSVPASRHRDGEVKKHNSGIYVTRVPVDPSTGLCSIDYKEAEERGYFKIDLLNQSVYTLIRDQKHYDNMLKKEPNWSRLYQDSEWAKQLVHVGNYTDLLDKMRPDSIVRMAAFISVIRPGKAHLQQCSWQQIFSEVWDGNEQHGYTFKQSHAIGYAQLVALHMNLLEDQEINSAV